jgi:hypothetical protein
VTPKRGGVWLRSHGDALPVSELGNAAHQGQGTLANGPQPENAGTVSRSFADSQSAGGVGASFTFAGGYGGNRQPGGESYCYWRQISVAVKSGYRGIESVMTRHRRDD